MDTTALIPVALTLLGLGVIFLIHRRSRQNQKEEYEKLAKRLGFQFTQTSPSLGGLIGGKMGVEGHIQGNSFQLFTHTQGTGKSKKTYTNVAIVLNKAFPSTLIRKQNSLSFIAKKLGLQDIELGNPTIDDLYIFKSSDENAFKNLMQKDLQALFIEMAPEIKGRIKIDSSLRYTESGIITSPKEREQWEKIIALCSTLVEKIDSLK